MAETFKKTNSDIGDFFQTMLNKSVNKKLDHFLISNSILFEPAPPKKTKKKPYICISSLMIDWVTGSESVRT